MDKLVAIINAQGVLNEVVESNIEILEEEGFLILEKKKVQLTLDQASKLNVPESELKYYTMGPVVILLIGREDAFAVMNDIFPQLDDLYYTHTSYLALRDKHLLFPTKPLLERTLCVVKPGYTQEDMTVILDALAEYNFVVLGKVARVLSLDVAALFAPDQDIAQHLASEVSLVLVLEKLNAIDELQLLLGPEDPEEARLLAPYSLRARIGQDLLRNVAYASNTVDKASVDILSIFTHPFPLERSVCLVKPDVVNQLDTVLTALEDSGFTVLARDTFHMSKTRCESFYSQLKGSDSFPAIVSYMSSGPTVAILVSKPAAVASLRTLVGPADPIAARQLSSFSLRARLGTDAIRNGIDASSDAACVVRETRVFFPHLAAEHIPSSTEVDMLLSQREPLRPNAPSTKSLKDVIGEGLAQLCRVKPQGDDAIRWFANWLLRNNPNKPVMITEEPEDEEDAVLAKSGLNAIVSTKSVVSNTTTLAGVPSVANDTKEVVVTVKVQPKHVEVLGAASSKLVSIKPPARKPSIVWSLGGPGSGQDVLVPLVGSQINYDVINVPNLITTSMTQATETGRLLSKHHKLGRAAPSHVVVSLIQEAIAASQGTQVGAGPKGFILSQFPLSLDDAFAFETAFGSPAKVLVLSCGEDAALTRLVQAQSAPLLKEDLLVSVKTFAETTQPVVEHFNLFNKVISLSTDDTLAAPIDMTRLVIAPQLTEALAVHEKTDKLPAKPRMAPKKPVPVQDPDEAY